MLASANVLRNYNGKLSQRPDDLQEDYPSKMMSSSMGHHVPASVGEVHQQLAQIRNGIGSTGTLTFQQQLENLLKNGGHN